MPDGSVGLGLGNQTRGLLGWENILLCAMHLFHFLHDDGGQLQEFSSWVSPMCRRFFCRTLLPSRTVCTNWTWVRLCSESNFLRMDKAVVIVEREAEAVPLFVGSTTTVVGRIAAVK